MLYVVYSIVGGGTLFDEAATQGGGWIPSYQGAGPKITFVGRVDTGTGVVLTGTFVESRLPPSKGSKINSLMPTDPIHVLLDGALEFYSTEVAYTPLNPDRSLPDCGSAYPSSYRARFTPDLKTMSCATIGGCKGSMECPQ